LSTGTQILRQSDAILIDLDQNCLLMKKKMTYNNFILEEVGGSEDPELLKVESREQQLNAQYK